MNKYSRPKTDLAVRPADAATVLETEKARLAIELAAKQLELEADAKPESLAMIVVESESDYQLVTTLRAKVRATKDDLVRLRQTASQPWKKVGDAIDAMFRPSVRAAETIEADFRAKLEAFQVAKIRAEREAREAATKAAQADDSDALVSALNASVELAKPVADGGRVSTRWTVKRIVPDLLPAEYWTPDIAKIEAVARAHKGEDKPVIPGVVFEEAVTVAVRR